MASISSEAENAALYEFMMEKGIENAYFGWYLDEETNIWQWVSGEDLTYTNWDKGEPNRSMGKENTVCFIINIRQDNGMMEILGMLQRMVEQHLSVNGMVIQRTFND